MYILLFLFIMFSHTTIANDYSKTDSPVGNNAQNIKTIELLVLGIAQDAGYPQLNCYKEHCLPGWHDHNLRKMATSLAIIDHNSHKKYLFEATPDIKQQMFQLHQKAPDPQFNLEGIFITHAHIGHYTGLMHFGREAAGTQGVNVFAMPKMKHFLMNNAPWSQLVKLNNISINELQNQQTITLSKSLTVTPFLVPHRDEFSETVGYKISGPNKTVLFIPDIDKWQKWHKNIVEEIKSVDYAFLDATFFANGEIPNRDMSQIPHPFVEESIQMFSSLSLADKNKVFFIHFNHSNPLLQENNEAQNLVKKQGMNIASESMTVDL